MLSVMCRLRGSVYSYYSHRPWFDPELWHLSAQRAGRMLQSTFLLQESQAQHAVPYEMAIM